MPQEDIAIEKHLAMEWLPGKHAWKPQTIVSPHPVIRSRAGDTLGPFPAEFFCV
jgi:hypothetical protein